MTSFQKRVALVTALMAALEVNLGLDDGGNNEYPIRVHYIDNLGKAAAIDADPETGWTFQ